MPSRVFLDWNATAPLRPEARAAMLAVLDAPGNASSVHSEGRAARQLVERARQDVAALVGANPRNVTFTSGATEANALALARPPGTSPARLLVSAIEHPSVRASGRFPPAEIVEISVSPTGILDLSDLSRHLQQALAEGRTPLVAIMAANNETGVVQPVAEAAALTHEAGGLLLVDAVQAAGRMTFNINDMAADYVTLSAHKLGGPQGAGALIRRDDRVPLTALIAGGGQERGLRGGTENVAALAGFGAAAAIALQNRPNEAERTLRMRNRLEAGLRHATRDLVIFGAEAERLPNTTLFRAAGVKAETALISLDLAGFAVSSGSACSSGKVGPSHVLAAMGVPAALAAGAVRVSTGYSNDEKDIEAFLEAWRKCAAALGRGGESAAA